MKTAKLSRVQCLAIHKLSEEAPGRDYRIKGEMHGVGLPTLDALVSMGIAEVGKPSRWPNEVGWRLTAEGWKVADAQ